MTNPHQIIRALRNSPIPRDRQRIYLGRRWSDGSPVFVDLRDLIEHVAFVGANGSGKTAGIRMLMWQVASLMRDASFLVVDGKADTPELRAELERMGGDVHYLSIEPGLSSDCFNVLDQPWYEALGEQQQIDFWMGALNLDYGTGYGESYYTDGNAVVLHEAMSRRPKTMREFARAVDHAIGGKPLSR